MLRYKSEGVLYLVIQDGDGETYIDIAGDFDGYSLMRVYATGKVELLNEIKTGQATHDHFGVTE